METNLVPQSNEEKKEVNIQQLLSQKMFHTGTPQNHVCLRGVGITRKNKSKSKKNLKIEKKSRKINRKTK